MTLRLHATLLAVAFAFVLSVMPVRAQAPAAVEARNVVLVHGAWADGSSWTEVIPFLQAAGLKVTAVQNPLTSVADDVAAARRALALQDGPTVLVGHSYAGTVISEAGADAKVTALVYVASHAADAGEDFPSVTAKFPTTPVRAGIQNHNGLLYLTEEAVIDHFASGLPREKARVIYAVQQPIAATLFAGRISVAAWHDKPAWYAVSKQDHVVSPDLQRFLAARMKATTVELDAGHLSLISHPREVADIILAAAGRKK